MFTLSFAVALWFCATELSPGSSRQWAVLWTLQFHELLSFLFHRWNKKKKAGTEVWCSDSVSRLPTKKISPLIPDLFASYSGPDKGLAWVHTLNNANNESGTSSVPNAYRQTSIPETGW